MKVLIDTNVALTYVSGRDDTYSGEIDEIMRLCAEDAVEGAIALHTLSTIWYCARKLPDDIRRDWIRQLCILFTVTGADNAALIQAVEQTDFRDFEDAMQDCCASAFEADYIITANVRDFEGHSRVPAVTPTTFMEHIAPALE